MTTSGRPAYDNLAGHPFGVNAKWLQTNKQTNKSHSARTELFFADAMSEIAGLHYIESHLHSQKLPFLDMHNHCQLCFMRFAWLWVGGHWLSPWTESAFHLPAQLMEIGLYNPSGDGVFWQRSYTIQSKSISVSTTSQEQLWHCHNQDLLYLLVWYYHSDW